MQINPFRFLFSSLIATLGISFAPPSLACFRELTRDDLLHRLHYEIERKLEISLNAQGLAGIGHPKVTLLRPLGEDCSGLSFAFYITKYRFTINYGGAICEHDGVIVLKGTQPNSAIEVQDDKYCPADGAAPRPPIDSWSGNWNNEATEGAIKRLIIDMTNHSISVFGFCGGGECDWGTRPLEIQEGSDLTSVTYRQGNGTVTLDIRNLRDRLQVQYSKRFDAASGGQVVELTEYFRAR